MERIIVESPAKINLCLRILGRRKDGYHNIFSIMQVIDLMDVIEIEKSKTFSIQVDGAIIEGENIILKAWKILSNAMSKDLGVNVKLYKRIPIGAGLGGGSSDAAAFLSAINRLYELGLDTKFMMKLASEVGSDVPFFLSTGSAMVTGRGEIVESIQLPLDYYILLIVPNYSISTARAYSLIKNILTSIDDINNIKNCLSNDFYKVLREFKNDFEPVIGAEHPELIESLSLLREYGAENSLLSGSGSAFFGIFRDAVDAMKASMHGWDGTVYLVRPIANRFDFSM